LKVNEENSRIRLSQRYGSADPDPDPVPRCHGSETLGQEREYLTVSTVLDIDKIKDDTLSLVTKVLMRGKERK
jgi:hypothetical protein